MIGPAELEDLRFDLAEAERTSICDSAMASLNAYWAGRGAPSEGIVLAVADQVYARSLDRRTHERRAVCIEAVRTAGYGVEWIGGRIASAQQVT
ncbi:hypothetical protein [Methylobacterium iners]|uniref:Uncharacterized protein n=1 Tax=Methylobacterium iners TaxID=418707 RepID=A0ABQ4S1Q4_9HYPH|nr:hypothetical protein [Methylobacterium iners]GJD96107.1 hypothetical protein OCOJLMKI_3325 [Methylobacterium iners]